MSIVPLLNKKKAKQCLSISRRWQSQVTDLDRRFLRQMTAHWARTTPAWEVADTVQGGSIQTEADPWLA